MARLNTRYRGLSGVVPGALALVVAACCSPAQANESVRACGTSYGAGVFAGSSAPSLTASAVCPADQAGTGLELYNGRGTARGDTARFEADAPAGLQIVAAGVPSMSALNVNSSQGFGGGFYWQGGGSQVSQYQSAALIGGFSSSYLGFQLICGWNQCKETPGAHIFVSDIVLSVNETVGPSFAAPTGLWQASGWVRAIWPFFAWGNSPSGLCSLSASLNGLLINRTTAVPDPSAWHQCFAPPINQSVDTSRFGEGKMPLTLSSSDAAGVPASLTKDFYVDNAAPTVTLNGPSDAPSTGGPQYVTATATAGPSGVQGIDCSLDGGSNQWTAGSTARVAVSGIGDHVVSCFSQNNALDAHGTRGTSGTQSFAVKIGVPTVTGISFSKLVDRLRCRHLSERVTVPSRWVTVRWHHRRIRVRTRGRTKVLRVVRCHARTVQRERVVSVTVIRHGHRVRVRRRERVRVILLPHTDHRTIRLVAHGHATAISGWLGTYMGTALGGQSVQILTAPDDGGELFAPVVTATTAPDGSWSATLPAGPSRLIEAQYAGNALTEGSLSGLAREVVPAKVRLLSVSPGRVPWGGTVRLRGRLRGGYLPPGGALVRLRIGLGSSYTTYGVHEHVGGNGRFTTSYTFGAGDPAVYRRFWFQVASLPMGNYPYAPASSRRISVQVGGHPRVQRRR